MKCLIIKKEHLDKILSGEKTWEMRSRMTKIRGRIGLIESGTGTIVGECELYDCSDMSHLRVEGLYRLYLKNHCVNNVTTLQDWNKAWHLKNAKRYDNPIPYKHPQGAVVWVNVDEEE